MRKREKETEKQVKGACNSHEESIYYSLASLEDTPMMSFGGVLMYVINAADFHLPSVWMRESLSPAWAAAVAAPIRKE